MTPYFLMVIFIVSISIFVVQGEVKQKEIEVSKKLNTKIVGGVEAEKNEFPWLVRIQWKSSKTLLCGGTIIREDLILTASHCVYNESPSRLEIIAGDHDSDVKEDSEQSRNIRKITCHKDYDDEQFTNDICLLKLSSNLTFTKEVNRIELHQTVTLPTSAIVAGWGLNADPNDSPGPHDPQRFLQKVTVEFVSNDECSRLYRGSATITTKMACFGQENKDSCQGDSGGGLICKSANNVTTVCGVVSFGAGCGKKGYPGVYCRVEPYRDWISENSKGVKINPISITLLVLFSQIFIKIKNYFAYNNF